MKLSDALGLLGYQTVAFTGAGGKTSAMFALARELNPPVVLSTTTHLGVWQAALADKHYIIKDVKAINQLDLSTDDLVLVTGPQGSDERLRGLNDQEMGALASFCAQEKVPLLIEADGARQKALTAPAGNEPVIPSWVDHVVVLAGLDGLDQQLNVDSVHRPAVFSKLSGIKMGEPITIRGLVAVLGSEQGGLKGIPKGSSKTLFLNQADDEISKAKGRRVASSLLDAYDSVWIGSLHQPGSAGPIFAAHRQIAGVILAAGGSERLGRSKQFLSWSGKPFIVQMVENGLAAGLAPLKIITGADHDAIVEILAGYPVDFIHNIDWAEGQSTSMKAGLRVLPETIGGVVFLLSDQPQISPLLIRQLLERFAETGSPISAPIAGGKRGNPVLFARETFQALLGVSGDQGGRAVFNRFSVDWSTWVDDRILLDVDKPGDEESLQKAFFPSN